MRVDKQTWEARMNNLNERRARGPIKNSVAGVDNYSAHIRKGYIGKTVLDVGCGSMLIKSQLPPNVSYTGIDPFPSSSEPIKGTIEDHDFDGMTFETIYAFAMLDNVIDLEKAIENMKRICTRNMMFLTGVNIEPDQYHTVKITEGLLIGLMAGFHITYQEYLHPKILLIEFTRNGI